MKFKLILNLIILFIFAPIYGQNREVKRVAILETVDKEGTVSYGIKLMVRSKICAAITETPGYEGYDRVDVTSIMDEQEFQRTGMVDDAQIKELGVMTGADYILIAEVASLGGSDIIITAKILEVESGRMENASDVYTSLSPAELDKNCRILSGKLLNLNIETGAVKGEIMINKDRYVGEYINGKPHGKGTIYYASDDSYKRKSYEGDWVNGKRQGHGTMIWNDGEKYVGEWNDNSRHGKGTQYYTDGGRYVGNWVNGKFNGQGTRTWADGRKYVGGYKDDKRHGKGTFYWPNGDYEEANWQNGEKEGFATYYFSSNHYKKGYYVNGKKEGKWEEYRDGWHTWTLTYKNGEKKKSKFHYK